MTLWNEDTWTGDKKPILPGAEREILDNERLLDYCRRNN